MFQFIDTVYLNVIKGSTPLHLNRNTYLHTFVYMYILKRTVFSIYFELTKYFIKAINMRGHIIATITKKNVHFWKKNPQMKQIFQLKYINL